MSMYHRRRLLWLPAPSVEQDDGLSPEAADLLNRIAAIHNPAYDSGATSSDPSAAVNGVSRRAPCEARL